MPLPMVHLSIAYRLVVERGFPDTGEFYLGSLSPDAIHMRDGTTGDDKKACHFGKDTPVAFDLAALADMLKERRNAPFAVGYAAHVLADKLWHERINAGFKARIQAAGLENERHAIYYREFDRLDLDLYDTAPCRPVAWARLASAHACGFPPFLSGPEVAAWRDRVLGWYDANPGKRLYEPAWSCAADVEAFIEAAAAEVGALLEGWMETA
jgi:hypothetical protein